MKRPTGVTVIVIVNLVVTFAWLAIKAVLAQAISTDDFLLIILGAFFCIVLSVALIRLKNWARWTYAVLCVVSLIRIPGRVVAADGDLFQITGVLVSGLFVAWAVSYLFRTHVKAAFGEE
jgi:hypothetical protein